MNPPAPSEPRVPAGGAAASSNPASPSAPAAPAAVEATDLAKDYGFRRVLDGVSIKVPAGTFYSLFGPNGAGKTTLVKILTTLSRPTAGTVRIAGEESRGPRVSWIRSRIGLISHQTLLYDGMTALENLVFFGRLYGVPRPADRAGALLTELRLWDRRHDRAGTYSRGMLQRLAIARALMHDPEILFLDEPFTGLDPAASLLLRGLLERLKEGGRSAVLVTHDLAEGLALADRWGILAFGRVAAEGRAETTTLPELTDAYFAAARIDRNAAGAGPSQGPAAQGDPRQTPPRPGGGA